MADIWFVWIPKNAGTSIEQTLTAVKRPLISGLLSTWRFDCVEIACIGHTQCTSQSSNWEYLAVCRHPIDRAVSLYHASHLQHAEQGVSTFAEWCESLGEGRLRWDVGPYAHNLLCPQSDYCERIDHLLQFETLADDWAAFARRVGLPPDSSTLQHQKRNPATAGVDWRDIVTPRQVRILAEYYQADFERFGYTLE